MGRFLKRWIKFKESGIGRLFRNPYFLATLFFLVWILFIDENTLFSWASDYFKVKDQERQKLYYLEEIRKTEEKLDELNSNVDSLEKFAREQYLFHKADEDVYIIKKN